MTENGAAPSSPATPAEPAPYRSPDHPISHVLIMVAMEGEAMPMIHALKLERQPGYFGHAAPFHCFMGTFQGHKVSVVTNGKDKKYGCDNIGTVPAALATYLAVEALKPDLLINAGTCGGFRAKGGEIGDVYVSSLLRNHDRRLVIPSYVEYGIQRHESVATPKLRQALNCKHGVVSTGNSLDHVPADDALMAANDASVKDMEGAAVAWAAELYGIPYFAVKVVTDIVDGGHPTEEEFLANFSLAQGRLQEAIPAVLDFIIGRRIEDL